jgi:uncharacterized damage-inducible protein DinB
VSSIPAIISYLEFGRSELLQTVEGLSDRELTQIPIYESWTIKDVLAHVIGWDQWVIKNLPLILQNRASEIARVDAEAQNRRSLEAWQDKPLAEVLTTIKSTHQQIVDIISSLDHVEIDMRRERNGRTVTIRSYVIEVMVEHERQHAVEIEQWRIALEQAIDPETIKEILAQNRTKLLAAIEGLNDADLLDKTAVDSWSVKDVIGHIAYWEQQMLDGARHIHNPSLPTVSGLRTIDELDEWNEMMVAKQDSRSWQEVFAHLSETRQALQDFITKLKPADWLLRGPYPWPDQGTLAQLVTYVAEHDAEHLPALEKWCNEKKNL